MDIPSPSTDLFRHLDFVQNFVGPDYLPVNYRDILKKINTRDEFIEIESDRNHPLWWFMPPILYDIFDCQTNYPWIEKNISSKSSIIVIPPTFESINPRITAELSEIGLNTTVTHRLFTTRFTALLYGGYPWFEAYLRVIKVNCLDSRNCIVLKVSSDEHNVPETLELFKRKRRHYFGNPIQLACADLPYSGLVRPFHIPSIFETSRHSLAAELKPI